MFPVANVIFQTLICVLQLLRLVAKRLKNREALPDHSKAVCSWILAPGGSQAEHGCLQAPQKIQHHPLTVFPSIAPLFRSSQLNQPSLLTLVLPLGKSDFCILIGFGLLNCRASHVGMAARSPSLPSLQ